MLRPLLVAACLLGASLATAQTFTARELVAQCKGVRGTESGDTDRLACLSYIRGIGDLLTQQRAVCMPAATSIGDTRRLVVHWVALHPEHASKVAAFAVHGALTEAYPCRAPADAR